MVLLPYLPNARGEPPPEAGSKARADALGARLHCVVRRRLK